MGPTEVGTEQRQSDACDADRRTIATASEAFHAVFGRLPESVDELVGAEYLMQSTDAFDIVAVDGPELVSVEPVPGGDCDLPE